MGMDNISDKVNINVGNQVQRVKSDQDIVNFGTMAASGNQATTSTQVR